MKKIGWLLVAVVGNGIGSAIMFQTHVGMTAWGTSVANVSAVLTITPGWAFILVSAVFYAIAVIVRRRFDPIELLLSGLFLIAFSYLLDLFIGNLPDFSIMKVWLRVLINFGGLLVLLLSIALHIKINIAVHPMDVFLKTMQEQVFHNVAYGTYFAYFCAFVVALVFGLIDGAIHDVGIGTIMTLTLSGAIMSLYNNTILKNFMKEQ